MEANNFLLSKGNCERPEMLKLNIDRPLYENDLLCQDYHYEKPKKSSLNTLSNCCDIKKCNKELVYQTIPALKWLRCYQWRENILPDIVAGVTVSIMHIPQGMAYGLLGNLPPISGIYMAFFPVLIYVIFGTSKHVSMGTFALVCLMTGRIVDTYSDTNAVHIDELSKNNYSTNMFATQEKLTEIQTPIEVATAVTFMVGIIQLVMYIFRLGVISSLLSEPFVNGFTTAAAIHVLTSQIGDLLGLKLPKYRGYFKCIHVVNTIGKILG